MEPHRNLKNQRASSTKTENVFNKFNFEKRNKTLGYLFVDFYLSMYIKTNVQFVVW